MRSFYGQTDRQQEELTALYWQNIEEAEAERRYLRRYSDGRLFINAPAGYLSETFDNPYRREDLARLWAYSPIDRQTRRQRLYWLQSQTWETGVYWGYRVIIFFNTAILLVYSVIMGSSVVIGHIFSIISIVSSYIRERKVSCEK